MHLHAVSVSSCRVEGGRHSGAVRANSANFEGTRICPLIHGSCWQSTLTSKSMVNDGPTTLRSAGATTTTCTISRAGRDVCVSKESCAEPPWSCPSPLPSCNMAVPSSTGRAVLCQTACAPLLRERTSVQSHDNTKHMVHGQPARPIHADALTLSRVRFGIRMQLGPAQSSVAAPPAQTLLTTLRPSN